MYDYLEDAMLFSNSLSLSSKKHIPAERPPVTPYAFVRSTSKALLIPPNNKDFHPPNPHASLSRPRQIPLQHAPPLPLPLPVPLWPRPLGNPPTHITPAVTQHQAPHRLGAHLNPQHQPGVECACVDHPHRRVDPLVRLLRVRRLRGRGCDEYGHDGGEVGGEGLGEGLREGRASGGEGFVGEV